MLTNYATSLDRILFIIGFTLCTLNGAIGAACGSIFSRLFQVIQHAQARYVNGTLDNQWLQAEMFGFAITYLLVAVVLMVSSFVAISCFHIASARVISTIRRRLFFAELNKRPVTDVKFYHKFTVMLDLMQRGTGIKFVFVTQAFTTAFFGIIVGLAINWKLTVFLVFMFPLVLPFVWLPETTTNRLKEKEGAAYMKANTIVVQSILNDQLEVEEEYNQHVDDALRIGTQKAVLSTSYGGFYYTIMLAFMTAGAWFGMNSIWEDRSVRATGDLFTVFWLLFVGAVRVGQSVPQLGAIWAAVTTGQKVLKELDPTLSLNDAIVPTATMSTIDENLFDQKSLDVDTQPIIGVANNTFDSDHLRVISVTNRHLQFLESQSSPKPNAVVRSSLLKMILKLCGREVAILTTAIVAMIVRSCIWPLYTWLLGQFNEMLNDPTPMANKNTAILFATTLVIVSLLGGLLNFSGSAAMAVLGERIGRRCRAAALKSRTSNESKASSIKNLLSVPVQIQIAIDTRFSDILEATLALMLILYTAAYYNWQIALVELGVVVLYEFCQLQVFSNLFPKVQKLFELEEKTLNLLIESSTSAMTTPLRITREKYNELADQTHKSLVRIGLCEAFSFAMGMSYEGLNFALIYLLGTCFYADLGFSPFSYFQVAQMVNGGFLISIIPTASYAPELVRALVAASRLSALTTRDNHQL